MDFDHSKGKAPNRAKMFTKENIGYGYSRNLLGGRYLGIASASISLAWGQIRTGIVYPQKINVSPDSFSRLGASTGTALALVILILCIWIFLSPKTLSCA